MLWKSKADALENVRNRSLRTVRQKEKDKDGLASDLFKAF